jgi:broad specificity phosphatase PhoE
MTARSILCIRHGESTFNAAWRAAAADPLHFDAPLSPVGVEQVRQARRALEHLPVELVVTSPLTRALQTTAGLFDGHRHSPRIVVHALMRERVENSCDVGRSPAELAVDFPALDLAHLDEDWWHVDGVPDMRGICIEPVASVAARALKFKSYLRTRPERCIAVVGHGTFLFHLTGRTLANCETADVELELVGQTGASDDA